MNLKNSLSALAAALCLAILAAKAVSAAPPAGKFEIVDHWKIGGDGGWDYLLADPAAHALRSRAAARAVWSGRSLPGHGTVLTLPAAQPIRRTFARP